MTTLPYTPVQLPLGAAQPDGPWDVRAREFHRKHPEVMDEIVALCRQWRERGRDEWGIKAAFEVVRFQRRLAGLPDPQESFKLNNNYTAWYAREVMRRYPDLRTPPVFRLRERGNEKGAAGTAPRATA